MVEGRDGRGKGWKRKGMEEWDRTVSCGQFEDVVKAENKYYLAIMRAHGMEKLTGEGVN
jgi:hypothetical protein